MLMPDTSHRKMILNGGKVSVRLHVKRHSPLQVAVRSTQVAGGVSSGWRVATQLLPGLLSLGTRSENSLCVCHSFSGCIFSSLSSLSSFQRRSVCVCFTLNACIQFNQPISYSDIYLTLTQMLSLNTPFITYSL